MGIEIIDPGFSPIDCLDLYPAGEMPLQIVTTFSGIQPGSLWGPGFGPPLNGNFILPRTGVCRYTLIVGMWTIRFERSGANALYQIADRPMAFIKMFLATDPLPPIFYAENEFDIWAGTRFYGGNCKISW